MKNLLLILTALLISTTIFAQAPNKMSYQTVIRNSSNALVTSQGVGIQISVLQGSATGTAVYVERHSPNTNANGLASFEIGSGTSISGNISTINWGSGTYFIKTETDPNGGTNYTITGTSQLLSVPYSLHAKTATSLVGGLGWTVSGPNVYTRDTGNVGIGIPFPNAKLNINGNLVNPALRVQVSGNTKLVVNPNGGTSIGVFGITPPVDGLYVHGAGGAAVDIQTRGRLWSNSATGGMWLSDGQDCFVGNRDADSFGFWTNNDGFSAFLINKITGNIGIGSYDDNYRLEVNGTVAKPGGGSWTATSDKRLKDRVVPFEDGLTSVMAIKPVKFHYNKKSGIDSEKEYVGVIAQELKEVAPYMVGTFEKDGVEYFDVDNSAMMYLLVNAVQEQQKEKEVQTARIESLEKQLETLNAKLDSLLEKK